jgi:hypothetical protein
MQFLLSPFDSIRDIIARAKTWLAVDNFTKVSAYYKNEKLNKL